MNLESFEYLLNKLKEVSKNDQSFYKLGLDLQSIVDPYHEIISHLFLSINCDFTLLVSVILRIYFIIDCAQ